MSRHPGRRGRPAPSPPRSRSSLLPLAIAGSVVLGAAAIALLVTRPPVAPPGSTPAGPTASSPAPTRPGSLTGSSLSPFVSSAADPAIGQPAPEVEGTSFDGTPVAIRADGRPKLIVFLAHWCPHCQREVPVVQGWLDAKGATTGVDLISVATAIDPSRPNYPPDAWLQRERWSVPVIVDQDGQIAGRYGLSAFPYWVLVDRDGRVAGRLTGELPVSDLEAIVARLAAS